MKIDLNADLGEREPPSRTRALMALIDSANIATGGHAGTVKTMDATIRLALRRGVRIGAHPGFADGGRFGRAAMPLTPTGLEELLLQQVGVLDEVARRAGGTLHHVKLHGALYHAVEEGAALARSYAETVGQYFPGMKIYAFAGGQVVGAAQRAGVEVWGEAFADRGYLPDGRLIPRGEAGDVIVDSNEALTRLDALLDRGSAEVRTVCVHADSPNAVRLARTLAAWLRQRSEEE